MALIRRETTRTIKNTTETTSSTDTPSATALAFNLTASDSFYLGFRKPFTTRYFLMGVVNAVANTVTPTYWDGDSWASVEDFIDQTVGFTQSGFMSWGNLTDWTAKALTPVTDVELYWLKLVTNQSLTSSATLQAVLNLFCDDTLLRTYYPELVSDSRYLPSGRSDFMEQYIAAKDLIVQRLKQDKIITDESQIIDINEVAVAATHAGAWIIMNPIQRSEEGKESVKDAWLNMTKMLNKVGFDFDINDSGIIEDSEKEVGQSFITRG